VLKDEEPSLDATVQLAVDAVVKHNYAPALDALRDLEARVACPLLPVRS